MEAKKILKFSIISEILAGNHNTIREDRPNTHYMDKLQPLYDMVQGWIDEQLVKSDVRILVKLPETQKSTWEGFPNRYETQDDVPEMSDEARKKLWDDAKLKITASVKKKAIITGTPNDNGKIVESLPTDRKLVNLSGYKGLYSSKGKYYSNKVISGNLEIREFENLESAKNYLDLITKK